MAIKKPPERAAAARYPSPVHRRKKLIQRSIRLLVNERKDALGIVFQNRAVAAFNWNPARLPSESVTALRWNTQTDTLARLYMCLCSTLLGQKIKTVETR